MVDDVVVNPPFGRYPGGKNGSGIYQRLINLMPPHESYIEAFLGSGAIMRRKRPAPSHNIGIDLDPRVIQAHGAGVHYTLLQLDALTWLRDWFSDRKPAVNGALVYCDPPYLGSARARPERNCYRHEMLADREHVKLLDLITSLPAMVMISGYRSRLYDRALRGWRRIDYQAMTRGGVKPESVWLNFDEPTELHDYRFLGEDFHDRCRIARKIKRAVRKLEAMPSLERAAVLAALNDAAARRTPTSPNDE